MGPAEVFVALIVVGLPVILLMIIASRYFRLREKKLKQLAEWKAYKKQLARQKKRIAQEKAAQKAKKAHQARLQEKARGRANRSRRAE